MCRGRGTVEMGSVSFGTEWQVMETTYTVGVVAASMPQGGMCCGGSVMSGSVMAWLVELIYGNNHRVGTEADRRGRGGMKYV